MGVQPRLCRGSPALKVLNRGAWICGFDVCFIFHPVPLFPLFGSPPPSQKSRLGDAPGRKALGGCFMEASFSHSKDEVEHCYKLFF